MPRRKSTCREEYFIVIIRHWRYMFAGIDSLKLSVTVRLFTLAIHSIETYPISCDHCQHIHVPRDTNKN
jgi:hypothetical protein